LIQKMNNLSIPASEFNSAVKFLARVYALKKKGTFDEEKALRNNKRLAIIISSDPIWLIEHCGPFFLRYAEFIKYRNWDMLMKQEFTEEKERYKESADGVKHSYDAMDSKIGFIKKVFATCDDKERESMGDSVQTMLSAYCKYALEVKKNKVSIRNA
jgi:hypothetical protein